MTASSRGAHHRRRKFSGMSLSEIPLRGMVLAVLIWGSSLTLGNVNGSQRSGSAKSSNWPSRDQHPELGRARRWRDPDAAIRHPVS
jgi:hypothetical protein